MASKALSKEARAIVAQKVRASGRRLRERSGTEQIAIGLTAPAGASMAGLLAGYDVKIPIGKDGVSVAPIAALVGVGAGLAVGRGAVAASFFGFGVGTACAWVGKATEEWARKRAKAEADEKKAAEEAKAEEEV